MLITWHSAIFSRKSPGRFGLGWNFTLLFNYPNTDRRPLQFQKNGPDPQPFFTK